MNNSKTKYKIFLLSTYLDLIKECQAVIEVILNSNNIPSDYTWHNQNHPFIRVVCSTAISLSYWPALKGH